MDEQWRQEPEHVAQKGLVRQERDDGSVSLYNPGHGTSLDIESESRALVETILLAFAEPTTLDAFHAQHSEVPEELLELMIRSGFIVEERELSFLEHGFLRPTPSPVGEAWAWSDLPELAFAGGFVVVGVPVDMGALGTAGARHGPSEIRKVVNGSLLTGEGDVVDHEFERLYPALRVRVADLGDVEPDGGRLDHVGARLRKVVRELWQHEMCPLLLGGDHSLTHFVLTEALSHVERFGVIHFDAHHDMGPSRFVSHANVFASAIESDQVQTILQIGLRVIERVTPYAKRVPCPKRKVVTARAVARGEALRALQALPRDIPYYLSFDIDCIDAALARETGTPAFGGMSFEQASELVDYIARTFDLLGVDFVEVSSSQGQVNAAATMAASLLQRCVLGRSAYEPLSTDVYVLGG